MNRFCENVQHYWLSGVGTGGLGLLNSFDQEGDLRIVYLNGGNAKNQFVEKLDAAQVTFDGPDLEALNAVEVGDE